MIVSVLAIAFLVIVAFVAFIGYKAVILRGSKAVDQRNERCSICREQFDKNDLLLRQVGDYRLLYFCRSCIMQLYADLGLKN